MTTFAHPALPDEPNIGSIVEDRQGWIWVSELGDSRVTTRWVVAKHHAVKACDWQELLLVHGPVALIREGTVPVPSRQVVPTA